MNNLFWSIDMGLDKLKDTLSNMLSGEQVDMENLLAGNIEEDKDFKYDPTTGKLSNNFPLADHLKSSKAIELGVVEEQNNPPVEVIEKLTYHANKTLQPTRDYLAVPMNVTSGWRCKSVNDSVGSTDRSQHLLGEATDVKLSSRFLKSDKREEMDNLIESICGSRPRSNVNANYYMFAYFIINMKKLDIDQVIHEYGTDGLPVWIHVASSERQDRRRITIKRKGEKYKDLSLKDALLLGC